MNKLKVTLLAAALLLSANAFGQSRYNCTTTGCNFVSDPFPAPPVVQPNTCKLVVCNSAGCATHALKAQLVVAGPAGAVYCSWPNQVFNPGSYSVAAIAVAADGSESGLSNILSFQSSAGAPPAPVLKITSPAF